MNVPEEKLPWIIETFYNVAWSLVKHHDTAEELRSHTLFQLASGRFMPPAGKDELDSLLCWAWTVMRNQLRSIHNGYGRRDAAYQEYARRHLLARHLLSQTADENEEHLSSEFTGSDWAAIKFWSPKKRVFAMTRSLLYPKIPEWLWVRDLTTLSMSLQWPGTDYPDLTATQRNDRLAEGFGVPINTIHVRWMRWRKEVQSLPFARLILVKGE